MKYLASHGIDSKKIVIQRGARNYAGPHCPGKSWNCTTSKHVVQISYAMNVTQFTCTPSTGGVSIAPNDCVIVQSSSGAVNNAYCTEKIGDPSGTQSCAVYQLNTTGVNYASVTQQIAAVSGSTQDATQSTDIAQWNGTGSNAAQVNQDLAETQSKTIATGSFTQTQDGHQTVAIDQHSDAGNNTANVAQTLTLKLTAQGGASLTQRQDTNPSGYNTSVAIYQNSDDAFPGSGVNSASVSQTNDLTATASKTGFVTQVQGEENNGLFTHIDQHSSGVSTQTTKQLEHQTESAPGIAAANRDQTQIGPIHFDPDQGSNPGDRMFVDQKSDQTANPGADQDDRADASCDTSGICTVTQTIANRAGTGTNTCMAPSCNTGLEVTQSEGGPVFTCTNCADPPFSPPPPPNICDYIYGAPPCSSD
jgi:hypothetical protein